MTIQAPPKPDAEPVESTVLEQQPVAHVTKGGTRLVRTGVLFVPALIVLLVLAVATLQGVLPLNLAVAGQDFKITSNGGVVDAPDGLTLYGSTIDMKNGGKTRGVVIANLPTAILQKGMCLSVVLTFPVVGTYTIQLHTSGKTTVKQMTLDGASLKAGATTLNPKVRAGGRIGQIGDVQIPVLLGEDASDIGGPSGRFGVRAPAGALTGLKADAQGAEIAGTAKLAGLTVNIHSGRGPDNGECY